MRHSDYARETNVSVEPNCHVNEHQPVERQNILRVAEILTLLGFLHTPRYFAEFHLGLKAYQVEEFLKAKHDWVEANTIYHLQLKLNSIHNVLAQDVADAENTDQLWLAQARYNLLQTAFAHLI